VQATALVMLHPTLPIYTGVYLLPLRHPVLVARQLADIDRIAPGRLIFGVGVGGEDRHEVSICGVNPATRGLRMDEILTVASSDRYRAPSGKFFDFDDGHRSIIVRRPLIIEGRSDGDQAGRPARRWLAGHLEPPGLCRRPSRCCSKEAARIGRLGPPARHGMQVWCGLADSREAARACLAPAMEAFYQLPFERFERYCPYGTAEDVAEFLAPYVDAGCTEFNLIPQSPDQDVSIAGTAAVKGLLA
jgi:alkanesulfonate monooxygenase SsuD/methylene tetrahydromethanopterin reductase-like flavin-dependent oxidoreductase (luciferase family)